MHMYRFKRQISTDGHLQCFSLFRVNLIYVYCYSNNFNITIPAHDWRYLMSVDVVSVSFYHHIVNCFFIHIVSIKPDLR